jgi:hypothetical protein
MPGLRGQEGGEERKRPGAIPAFLSFIIPGQPAGLNLNQ